MAARLSQKPCKYFMNGFCSNGDNCLYSHDTTIYPCRFYHAFGYCEMDQACPFSHEDIVDEHELTQFIADNKDFLEVNKRELGDTVVAQYYLEFCKDTTVDFRLTGNFSDGHSGEEENQQDRANRRPSNQNSLGSIASLVSSKPVKVERKPSKDHGISTPKNTRKNVGVRYREDARGPHNTNSMFEMFPRKKRNMSEDSSPERGMFSGEKNENSQPLRDIRNGSRGHFQDDESIRRDNSRNRTNEPLTKSNNNVFGKSNFFVKDSSLDFLKLATKSKEPESGVIAPKDAIAKEDSSTASKDKSNTSSPAQIAPPKMASRTNSGALIITRADPRLINSRDPRESRDAKEAREKEAKEKEAREAASRKDDDDSKSFPLPVTLAKEVSNKSDPGNKEDAEKKIADKLKTLGILKKVA